MLPLEIEEESTFFVQPMGKKAGDEIFSSSSKGPLIRLAIFVSAIANPAYVAVLTFLGIAIHAAPHDLPHAVLWWGITVIGFAIAPLAFIWYGVRKGHYSDHHVSKREQRLVPLLFVMGCCLFVFALLAWTKAPLALIATATAVLIACGIATVITQFWKISIHLVGIAGAVTAYGLIFGPLCFLLFPLVLLVAWARWKVGAHTPLQALSGTLLAVSVTCLTLWLFGVVLL